MEALTNKADVLDTLDEVMDSSMAQRQIAFALSMVDECSPEALIKLSTMALDCAEKLALVKTWVKNANLAA